MQGKIFINQPWILVRRSKSSPYSNYNSRIKSLLVWQLRNTKVVGFYLAEWSVRYLHAIRSCVEGNNHNKKCLILELWFSLTLTNGTIFWNKMARWGLSGEWRNILFWMSLNMLYSSMRDIISFPWQVMQNRPAK